MRMAINKAWKDRPRTKIFYLSDRKSILDLASLADADYLAAVDCNSTVDYWLRRDREYEFCGKDLQSLLNAGFDR